MTGPIYPRPQPQPFIPETQIGLSPVGDVRPFDVWDTIESQYANSPALTALITSYWDAADQTGNLQAFFDNMWNIDTAIGYGLDVWGRIVGGEQFNRNVKIQSPIGYFSLDDPNLGLDNPDAPLFVPGDPLYNSTQTTLADPEFKLVILARAACNISGGSITEINHALNVIFAAYGSPVFISEANQSLPYMSYYLIQIGKTMSAVNLALLRQDLRPTYIDQFLPTRPSGVHVEAYVVSREGPIFGLDRNDDVIGGLDYGMLSMTPQQFIDSTI